MKLHSPAHGAYTRVVIGYRFSHEFLGVFGMANHSPWYDSSPIDCRSCEICEGSQRRSGDELPLLSRPERSGTHLESRPPAGSALKKNTENGLLLLLNMFSETLLNRRMESRAYEIAWDIGRAPERGPCYQPWRTFWPPDPNAKISPEEQAAKPWLTWKRSPNEVNVKPWYSWVNEFTGEVDTPCDNDCQYCGGSGCVSYSKPLHGIT